MLSKKHTLAISIALGITLTGCGGGSSESSSPTISPTPVLPVTPVTPPAVTPPINNSPIISASKLSVNEDTTLTATVIASDADDDTLSFAIYSQPQNGTVTINNSGEIAYQPALNFNGDDEFKVEVSDGSLSSTANITISVAPINDAPTARNINTITRLDQDINFDLQVQDVDGDPITFTVLNAPTQGKIVINDDKTATYSPTPGAEGLEKIQLSASDGTSSVNTTIVIDNNLALAGNIDITGLSAQNAKVLLGNDKQLITISPDTNGDFKVYGLIDGEYSIKVRKNGYKSSPTQTVNLNINELRGPQSKSTNSNETSVASGAPSANSLNFNMQWIDDSNFSYHWSEDQTTAGTDYAATINEARVIEFLDEKISPFNDASSHKLLHKYNIVLVDVPNGAVWTQEHAYRILETMKTIPQEQRDPYFKNTIAPSKWILSADFIDNDIEFVSTNGMQEVTVSAAAFVNAAPRLAKIEGKRGLFYSQRLHHAMVRFVTNNGTNKEAYEKILNERFGLSTVVDDYSALTSNTTRESSGRFQAFQADEIVQIINMFEEMPKGMHKLPELKYLVRRLNGTPHPLYNDAPAVAWATQEYIEFMESGFANSSLLYTHRLVIHEKAHFLWENQFDQQLKDDWITLGGWYIDPNNSDGWVTTKQTEFVSAYAHAKNPNEDMAESIAYFIKNPDVFRSRALTKYEFIRDRIMQGNIYISQIRDDLTFQVYNLFPDYVFPGKIKRIDISVEGAPQEDKTVTVELELHALSTQLEGASEAYMRLFSDIGTFIDFRVYPVEGDEDTGYRSVELGTKLRGTFSLSKFAKAGFWRPDQIIISDAVGNQRMESDNDFGWKLHINNPLEDLVQPEYVPNTATISKFVTQKEGQSVQIIRANWDLVEAVQMNAQSPCYASLNDELPNTYRIEAYGNTDEISNSCEVDFVMPDYMASSNYSMVFIRMVDAALNARGTYFTNSEGGLREEDINIDEPPQMIELITKNPDTQMPELDLNDIQISAIPVNPDAPNGETEVTITFAVRDNISGYNIASLFLRDPQGLTHNFWVYNEDTYSLFPQSDPSQWSTYTRTIILPVGSAPGTWGLAEMTIYDRANNFNQYDFTEIVRFDVQEQ